VIAERLAGNARLATLIHELGHALLASEQQDTKLSYAQEELVVESIAFCCCEAVGLDTSADSIPYLASWAESASREVLEQTAKLTDRHARRIEHALLAEPAAIEPRERQPVDAAQAERPEMSISASAPARAPARATWPARRTRAARFRSIAKPLPHRAAVCGNVCGSSSNNARQISSASSNGTGPGAQPAAARINPALERDFNTRRLSAAE
jgi:hypothetical protein